jgi:hypothetical protein
LLLDSISLMPEILPNARPSGVAILAAIVSGLAPGMLALTSIAGKSTSGSGATGSRKKLSAPISTNATASRQVATGRSINTCDKLNSRAALTSAWLRSLPPLS